MRALIAGDREAFYASEIAAREEEISAVRPAGEHRRLGVGIVRLAAGRPCARRFARCPPPPVTIACAYSVPPKRPYRGRAWTPSLPHSGARSPRNFDLSAYLR